MNTSNHKTRPEIVWGSVMLDCDNPKRLADFYAKLLGGSVHALPFTDELAIVTLPGTGMVLTFQTVEHYRPPVWPAKSPGDQQQMAHLDCKVKDREQAVAYALSLRATLPEEQLCPEGWHNSWTTLLDPAGHPFCLTKMHEE